MALLLSGLPRDVPGTTVNRLCASGLDAVGAAARAIRAGEIDFAIAGGVESMTRAPFVMGKAAEALRAHDRDPRHHDRLALRQPGDEGRYGIDSMPETGENVARGLPDRREDQDAFALRCQQRAGKAIAGGFFDDEIVAGRGAGRQGRPDPWSTRTSIRAPTRRSTSSPS